MDPKIFEAGDVILQSGMTLRRARLVYQTYGELNARRDNVVLIFTHFGAQHRDCEYMIDPDRAIDPRKFFVIIANLLGNGLSSSPSNTPAPFDRAQFPNATIYDNVRIQHRLITDTFGIERIALAVGHSMGAQQAFHWAALYPEMVERVAPICGSARISRHNFVFLEGMKAVLMTDPAWQGGWYSEPPRAGLRALGRAWSAWPPSQGFYREEAYRRLGYSSIEDFLVGYWEGTFLKLDANNILTQIWAWQNCDISGNLLYGGDFDRALGSIRAKAIVMPGETDTYFPAEDSAYEASRMPNASLRPIPSNWGHWAGSGRNPADRAFIDQALKELLQS